MGIKQVLDKYYHASSYWTEGELGIQLMKVLTPENVPELLSVTPLKVLERLKSQALCGKRIQVMCMGSGSGLEEAWERETVAFNKGLVILREYLESHT